MAKRSATGKMNTSIKIVRQTPDVLNDEGMLVNDGEIIVADTKCEWKNAHGTEVIEALRLGQKELATLTFRFHYDVTSDCILYKFGDDKPYEILSIDDVENRHEWIEMKIARMTKAR